MIPTGWESAVADLVRAGHLAGPRELVRLVTAALRPFGVAATVLLIDYEQRNLRPLADPAGPAVAVDGTLGGRAFAHVEPLPERGTPPGLWVPLVDGTARLGALHLRLPDDGDPTDPAFVDGARLLAGQIGHLLVSKALYGDVIALTRRSRPMTPAAELLWQMLPPLTAATPEIVITAVLEPCYDVGGDAFDYALEGGVAWMSVFDAVGRGMSAALTSAVTLAAGRAARRAGGDLAATVAAMDAELTAQFTDARFVTAVVARLDVGTGSLSYVNAGHPPPLLLRRGRSVRTLTGGRRPPLGVRGARTTVAVERFEPDDRLLFYTDGVTEARDGEGRMFGVERLVDAAERHAAAGLPPAETARRLAHAVIRHGVTDDATLALLEWSPAAARGSIP